MRSASSLLVAMTGEQTKNVVGHVKCKDSTFHTKTILLGIRNLKHKYLELFTTSKIFRATKKKNEVDVVFTVL